MKKYLVRTNALKRPTHDARKRQKIIFFRVQSLLLLSVQRRTFFIIFYPCSLTFKSFEVHARALSLFYNTPFFIMAVLISISGCAKYVPVVKVMECQQRPALV